MNGLKTDPAEFAKTAHFSESGCVAAEGFAYGAEDRPGRHPCHDAGVYYIQEPSDDCGFAFKPAAGEMILDRAAPGGKSTQAAAIMRRTSGEQRDPSGAGKRFLAEYRAHGNPNRL